MKPLAIDLFCGLGGWTDGLLAEGFDVIGFDVEQHVYGDHRYPGQLVLQDVLTLHGSQFRDAALIVASPPCQEYSYMAMPWKRAKAKAAAIRADESGQMLADLNRLFLACFRIQREACEAAGRHIPLIVENVRGAQPWVGRARWSFGSFYLWGDVPALMPLRFRGEQTKMPPAINESIRQGRSPARWTNVAEHYFGPIDGRKVGGDWFSSGENCSPMRACSSRESGVKQSGISGTRANGKGDRWFQDGAAKHGSKSSSRKAASAMIAKIPLPLSRHIGATFYPANLARAA